MCLQITGRSQVSVWVKAADRVHVKWVSVMTQGRIFLLLFHMKAVEKQEMYCLLFFFFLTISMNE